MIASLKQREFRKFIPIWFISTTLIGTVVNYGPILIDKMSGNDTGAASSEPLLTTGFIFVGVAILTAGTCILFGGLSDKIRGFSKDIIPEDFPSHLFVDDEYKKELESIYLEISEEFGTIRKRLEKSADRLDKIINERRKKIETSEWFKEVKKAERRYNILVKKNENRVGRFDPNIYRQWTLKKAELERKIKGINAKEKQLDSLKKEKEIILNKILEKRKKLSDMRVSFLQKSIRPCKNSKISAIKSLYFGLSCIVRGLPFICIIIQPNL